MNGKKNYIQMGFTACFLCLAVVLCMAEKGEAGKLETWSAEQVHIKDGKEKPAGYVYVAPEKTRMDIPAPDGKGKMIMIFRKDRMVTYSIFPGKEMYMERLLDEKDLGKRMGAFIKDVKNKEEALGTESVNGYKCKKKRVETTMNILGRNRTRTSTVWTSDMFDFPIRTESQEGDVMELRNIKPGKQPSSVFEVPSGYKKAANLMDIMMAGSEDDDGPDKRSGPGGRQRPPGEMPERLRELLYGPDNR